MSHACHGSWKCHHVLLTFDKVHNPLRLPRETTSERPKVVRTCGVFNILTWKCASRHSGVHFFDISTSKSAPTLRCFVHFDLEMCFAPQRRAPFHHLNFQKWTEAIIFYTFDLETRFAPQRREFFMSHLPRRFRARRFGKPTFRPSGATNHWKKHNVLRLFYLFAHLHLLSSDSFLGLFLFSDLL